MFTTTRARDVVDDDRQVAGRGDRLEMRDDPALRRLVVVRRDDEEAVDAELVRPLGQVDRVRGRVRPGAGDDRCVARRPPRARRGRGRAARASVSVGLSPVVPATTTPSEPLSTRWRASALERLEVDRAVLAKRRHDRGQDVAEHLRDSTRSPDGERPGAGRRRAGRATRRAASGRARSVDRQPEGLAARARTRRSRLAEPVAVRRPARDEEPQPAALQRRALLPTSSVGSCAASTVRGRA